MWHYTAYNILLSERLEGGGGQVPGPPALGEVDQPGGGGGRAHQQAQVGVAVHLIQLLPSIYTAQPVS